MPLKNQALSPLQALVVILALFIFGGLGYALYRVVGNARHQRNVKASIPKYLDGLRGQRDVLGQAIERYHAQFGFYPPNHSTNQTGRALINPLYYELVGTQWNTNFQTFRVPGAKETIKPETMEKLFNTMYFSNTLFYPLWPTNFTDGAGLAGRTEGEIFMVGSGTPEAIIEEIEDDFVVSPWRYANDPTEHNKGRFDLWIEVDVQGQHFVVGNWEGAR